MAERKFHYAWLIFIGCCSIMSGGMACCLLTSGIFFPSVCVDIGCSYGELSAYLSFYSIGAVIASPIAGHLLAKKNIRIIMSAACICVVLAEGMMSTYTHVWQWYISGAIFGLCGTFIFLLPTPLLIGNWFKKRTGFVLGIAMSFSGVGAAVWSQLFNYFISTFGWRTAYIFVAVIVAVLILPWTLFVFRFKPADMGLLPYGAVVNEASADNEKAVDKMHRGVALRHVIISIPFICIAVLSGCEEYYGSINSNIPTFALSIGMTASFGATMMSLTQIGNIVIKIAVGWLTDHIGVIKTAYIQMLVCAIACFILSTTQVDWALLIAALFLGVQNSVVTISEPMLVRHIFGLKHYAQIYSYVRVAAGLISAFTMPSVGFIYDFTGGYELAFIIGVVVSVLNSSLLFVTMRHLKKKAINIE